MWSGQAANCFWKTLNKAGVALEAGTALDLGEQLCFQGAGCHLGRFSLQGLPGAGARLQLGNQCRCIFSWLCSWKTLAERSLCTGGDWVWEEVVLGCLKIA